MSITESRDTDTKPNTNRNRGKIPKPNRLGNIQGYRTPGKDTSRLTLNAAGRPMTSLEASRLGGHTGRMHNGGALERCGSQGDILKWLHTTIVC